jgi:sugar/nucleoside kinase (ribokinase family)
MKPLNTNPAAWRYKALIGTGGIGSGTFFAFRGDHTLGREESRAGRFLDRRDYCKLHIIEHYIQVLLGEPFRTLAVGKVGDDAPGRQMIDEMREAGLSVERVEVAPGLQTLYSICFVYPDGTGGNLTVDDSASEHVDAALIRRTEPDFARFAGAGISLAAPEVPLEARAELLRLGRQYRFFNTACFTSGELRTQQARDLLPLVDFLALNIDEAAAVAGIPADGPAQGIALTAIKALQAIQPRIHCSITAGKRGSWTWDGRSLFFAQAHAVTVANTAGAGDSFFAGMIVGMVLGLSLPEAQQLATLIAACKVTCTHTINKTIDRDTLRTFATEARAPLADTIRHLLENQP